MRLGVTIRLSEVSWQSSDWIPSESTGRLLTFPLANRHAPRWGCSLFAARGSNVLVLDEPTNHLDLPAIEQLEAALQAFPHTVLLVTHDRRLLEAVTTNRHWHVDRGQVAERQ